MRTTPNTLLHTLLLAGLLVLASAGQGEAQRRPRAGAGKRSAPAAESAPVPETAEGAAIEPVPEPQVAPGQRAAATSLSPVPTSEVTDAATTAPAEPAPAAAAAPAPASAAPSALAKDVAGVMDELVQLRTRTRVLGKALFKTKVRIRVQNEAAPEQTAVRLQLWLDGAPVWSGDGTGLSDPERTLFEGLAAPGPHVLTYEVEQRARDDEKYRYTQRGSLRFVALRERRMELTLVLEDDSDMAEDFDEDEEGEYDVRVRLQVSAHRLGD